MDVGRVNCHSRLGDLGDFNEDFSHGCSPTETILDIVVQIATHVVCRTTLYATFFGNRECKNKRDSDRWP